MIHYKVTSIFYIYIYENENTNKNGYLQIILIRDYHCYLYRDIFGTFLYIRQLL